MDDLFEAQVQVEAERLALVKVRQEIDKIVSDPDLVIAAYQKKLEETKTKLANTTIKLTEVSKNYDTLVSIGSNYEMKDAAKLIKFIRSDGKQVGRNQLFEFLIDMDILCLDNSPRQVYVPGWFDFVIEKWENEGRTGAYKKTVVTLLGIEKIRGLLESSFETWWEK
jgi:phage antirepressor YoqD-like protein